MKCVSVAGTSILTDDDDTDDSTKTWADQRLRIAGKIAVAEGVSITFRTDITEKEWGQGSGDFGQAARSGGNQQWDRAHIDLTKGDWSFPRRSAVLRHRYYLGFRLPGPRHHG